MKYMLLENGLMGLRRKLPMNKMVGSAFEKGLAQMKAVSGAARKK